MLRCDLVSLSNNLQKRTGKLWTFPYPNGQHARLDYILMNRKWRNNAKNCEPYSSFESVGLYHRIVTAKIQLRLRANRTSKRNQQYDWSQLLNDTSVREAYAVEVSNCFEVLQALQEEELVETTYNNLISAHQEAAVKHVPKKTKWCKRTPWEEDNVLEL